MSNDTLSHDTLGQAQNLVTRLLGKGMSHIAIAKALGGRISPRTVYRWAKGEHAPQRKADLVALQKLAERVDPA